MRHDQNARAVQGLALLNGDVRNGSLALNFAIAREAIQASFTATAFALWNRLSQRVLVAQSQTSRSRPARWTAERADRPVERYIARIDPPDTIAGGATTREEIQ